MRVPKILYHGTTMLRWRFIEENGILRSNVAKSYPIEGYIGWNVGYVYLTTGINEAIIYGLRKSLLDTEYKDIPIDIIRTYPNYRDPVVIAVKTSNLRDHIEEDPELNLPSIRLRNKYRNFQWYRHEGDIKLGHLFVYKHYPFDAFSGDIIDEIKNRNETKLQEGTLNFPFA